MIAVRVTPRSSRDAIEGVDTQGELRVRVTAPPADGAANQAVAKLLAKALGVPKSAVTLVSGASNRHKRFRIDGRDAAAVEARLPGVTLGS